LKYKNLAIGIITCNRPNHLYVTLQSVFNIIGIKDCFTSIYQIYDDTTNRPLQFATLGSYAIDKVTTLKNRGTGAFLEAYRDLFYKENFDSVLLIPDDFILRPDLLDYIYSLDDLAFLDCLSFDDWSVANQRIPYMHPFSGVLNKDSFVFMDKWLNAQLSLGHMTFNENGRKYIWEVDSTHHFDAVMQSFVEFHTAICRYPDKPYIAHFGLTGLCSKNTPICYEFEAEIFSKDKFCWLSEFVKLIESPVEYPADIEYRLGPRIFRYGVAL
jgi:hypothetical protein